MQVITVSKAIAVIEKRTKIAGYSMVICWGFSMFVVIKLNRVFHWVFLGVFFSLALFLLLRSYMIVKWKIWAFEKVDNLPELITSAKNLKIIRSNIIPNKSTVCFETDRQKIIEIIQRRKTSKTIVIDVLDNRSIPHTFKIEDGKKANLMITIACFCIVYIPFERLYSKTSPHPENDYGLAVILLLAGFFFLYKTIVPSVIVSLSNSGIWTKKSNFQKWKAIENIYIYHEIDLKQQRLAYLVIVFNNLLGLEPKNIRQKFDLKKVNKDANEIEYAIKIFKQRFEKSAHFAIEHSTVKNPITNSGPKKDNPWFLLLFPFIVLLTGGFMWFKTTRPKEDYYTLKGKISYLEKSIGKHKNRSTKFLQIDSNPMVFKIFIGKESGDFSPELDRTDDLKLNDEVTIYYSSESVKKIIDDIPINKSIELIEKDNQLYFFEGTKNKYFAYLIIGIGLLLLLILSIIKFKK